MNYVIDKHHVVYMGKHYKTVINGNETNFCRDCIFVGSCLGDSFLKDEITCGKDEDGNRMIWAEVKVMIDNRSEYDKMVCDILLG